MGAGTMLRTLASRSIRGVSATNARTMATQAPLRLHGLDGRYATSLWRVATEKGEIAKVEKNLGDFKSQMGHEAMQQLLGNPSIPKHTKTAAISALMEKSG